MYIGEIDSIREGYDLFLSRREKTISVVVLENFFYAICGFPKLDTTSVWDLSLYISSKFTVHVEDIENQAILNIARAELTNSFDLWVSGNSFREELLIVIQ